MQVVKIQQLNHLLTVSAPAALNEVSSNPSYSRQHGGWNDDWDEK